MGRAIFYCVGCSKRLSDVDLEKGLALRAGDRIVCQKCATPADRAQALPAPEPSEETKSARRMRRSPSGKGSSTQVPIPEPASEPEPEGEPVPRGPRKAVLAGAVGGALLLLLAIGLLLGRKPAPASAAPPALSGEVADAKPKLTAADIHANHELERAREFARTNPGDGERLARILNDIVWKFEGTGAAREARKELERLKAAVLEAVSAETARLDEELKGPLSRKEYEAALALLGKAADRLKHSEWTMAVGKRVEDVKRLDKARRRELEEQREAAEPAKPPDKPADAPVLAAPVSAELKAYRTAWELALAKATARDYAGAAAEVKRASASLAEAPSRQEAERDLGDLLKIEALYKASMEALLRKPRGSGIALEVRDAAGELRRVSGGILQIDAERVELRGAKGPQFVEWADVSPSSLARAWPGKEPEPRTIALFGLLEGEAGPAKDVPVEEKWKAYGSAARSRLPKGDAAERTPRELFYAAEREYRSMETRLQASEKYRSLKTDYATSGIARMYLPRILRRSESGRDYFVSPPGFQAAGTFRLGKTGRLESVKDSDPNEAIENVAALEFAALPNAVYRMWLLAGGCCEETFSLLYQASELTDVHPTTKKKIACEPGGNFAAAVKHSIRGLKKTHAAHSPKKEPKRAERWEWIEIRLPKFTTPGLKKVVFMTDQGGFAIGAAWISSSAVKPPTEAEQKEFEKARLEDEPPLAVDPDLVGHWTFDDGGGSTAADLSGNGNDAVVNGARWVEGRIGGALRFEGKGEKVEAPDREALRLVGDFTIAFWMRKESECKDWIRMVGKGAGNERTFGVWQFSDMKKGIKFQQAGMGQWFDVDSAGVVETGQWAHIAAMIRGNRGTLYINGVKDSEKDRGQAPPASQSPLTFGSAPEHSSFNGCLDDVRLYKRALNPEEVKALYDLGR